MIYPILKLHFQNMLTIRTITLVKLDNFAWLMKKFCYVNAEILKLLLWKTDILIFLSEFCEDMQEI